MAEFWTEERIEKLPHILSSTNKVSHDLGPTAVLRSCAVSHFASCLVSKRLLERAE